MIGTHAVFDVRTLLGRLSLSYEVCKIQAIEALEIIL